MSNLKVELVDLRDYFAAKAMQAIISKSPFNANPPNYEMYEKTAIGAYDYADEMLKARHGAVKSD